MALDPQPTGAPVPCMTFTGLTLDSADIGVTRSGAVFYAPIQQLGQRSGRARGAQRRDVDLMPWAAFHCAYTSMCPGIRIGIAGRLAR